MGGGEGAAERGVKRGTKRELERAGVPKVEAEAEPGASIEALRRATVPVLLILGSISRSPFRIGTDALASALADATIVTIDGAAHAAHHTHVAEFVSAVERFLDGDSPPA